MAKEATSTKQAAPKRARTAKGHYIKDDPKTPNINEAFETEYVWYESRNEEPSMFPVASINPIRNFSNGRLEYKVEKSDVARFEMNHFVKNSRIVKKG